MVPKSITNIFRDFHLFGVFKNTAKQAQIFSFLDHDAELLIQKEITEY